MLKKLSKNSAVQKLTFYLYKNHKQVKQKDKSIFVLRINILSDLASKVEKHACIDYVVKRNNLQLIVYTVIKQAIQTKKHN